MRTGNDASSYVLTGAGASERQDMKSVERARAAGVIITAQLESRPKRPPQLAAENAALVSLARALTGAEEDLLQLLADTALALCSADSSGISLVEHPIADDSRFEWVAAAGICWPHVGASTPVNESPCGITIALGAPQLFGLPQRYFDALRGPTPEVIEGLVVEIPLGAGANGTIWVMSHREDRKFDLEDVRILTSLADFAGAALTVIRARKDAAQQAAEAVAVRAALEQSEQHRENFISVLGHELRNPMSPIDSAIAAAKRASSGNETVTGILAVAQRQMHQLRMLVDDLLDATRIRHGKFELKCSDIALTELIADAVSAVQYDIDARKHTLVVSGVAQSAFARVDRVRMSQMLSNLLSNASKYTPDGGRIELIVETQSYSACRVTDESFIGEVVFTVRDNGVGISAPELPHVFDMYKQAPSGNNRTEGGLGIGLAVAKRMVELHGGTIVIRSDGAHCGTEVILRLPTLVEPPEVTRRVPLAAVKPARILLVDDSDDALEAVGLMLKLEGHEVRTASGGMLALSVADEFRPDVALIDIAMPTVDGFELARNLRARAALARLTLIALTGHSSEADKARCLVSGFDLHLTKPLSLEALHRFLAEQAAQTRNVGL